MSVAFTVLLDRVYHYYCTIGGGVVVYTRFTMFEHYFLVRSHGDEFISVKAVIFHRITLFDALQGENVGNFSVLYHTSP
jgi:hypothetical protein